MRMSVMHRTKIVCTIGPASHTEEKLVALVEAGMDVCRLNFSHGTHEDHAALIALIRRVAKATGEPLAILQDLQGPKIRVGILPEAGVELVVGNEVIFTSETAAVLPRISVSYPRLHVDVRVGEKIALDDGLRAVEVVRVEGKDVICRVVTGGVLTSHKGMNLPDSHLVVSALSSKDREDVAFGVSQGVDWIALSFVRSPEDLQELKNLIAEEQRKAGDAESRILTIAKIEKPEAVAQIDGILAEADGIMVARGDLGIEVPAEKVPVIQKDIIKKCLLAGKPCIVATQMLDSMIHAPRATRAEVSDVANAVMDHADATMLSGETASGDHPIEAVATMAAVIREAEMSAYDDLPSSVRIQEDAQGGLSNIGEILSRAPEATAVVVATISGRTARWVSRYRPEMPIYAATIQERVMRQLNLSWGIRGMTVTDALTRHDVLEQAIERLKDGGLLASGGTFVVCAGESMGVRGHVNVAEVRSV